MPRQQVDAVGEPVRERGRGCRAALLKPAGGEAQLPLRQALDVGDADVEFADELLGATGPQLAVGDQRQRGALRDRAAEQAVGGRAGQQRQHRRRTGGLAEHRHAARVAAERGDVVTHPLQCGDLVAQREVVVEAVAEAGQFQAAEHPDAVGDVDDDHVAVGGQPRAVVELELAGAEHERAAGDPHHHRQRRGRVG